MLLAQVEGFLEVARRGNVSRAAEALFLTQPTLTARLHALERELGEPLFVRTRHGMKLTDSSRAFLPFAERAARTLREGREALREVRSGSTGQLVLGAAPAVSTYLLPALLERFTAAHPRVELAVRTGHSEDVLQMLLRDEIHIGLGRALRHPDVELVAFYEEELVLVVAPDHPYTRRRLLRMADLDGEKMILFDRTSSYYEITQSLFLGAGVSPRLVMELDSIEAAKKMVERKLGVAFLPRTAVGREMAQGILRQLPISDAVPVRRPVVALRRREAPASGLVGAFLDLLSHAQEIVPR